MRKKIKQKVSDQPDSSFISLEMELELTEQHGRYNTEERKAFRRRYLKELVSLQIELVKLQEWVRANGKRVVVLFEGRDTAGKGGTIKRIVQRTDPKVFRVEALSPPTTKEKTQWYFQRYVKRLPSAGEIVLFDRSWYNRGGVEPVMGYCTKEQHKQFIKDVPSFEKLLKNEGILLVKYYFSISKHEQQWRFKHREEVFLKQWKYSEVDKKAIELWDKYTKAEDIMFKETSSVHTPWFIVPSDDKKRARLNMISNLLSLFEYDGKKKRIRKKYKKGIPVVIKQKF